MVNGRAKGSSAEREVGKILFEHLGLTFKRDLEQYRAGDHGDLICDEMDFPFVIEVKRYRAGGHPPSPAWWDQVCKAARAADKLPLLVYRYDRQQWRWRMPAMAIINAGTPINMMGMRQDAELDWNYACEMDLETAMYLMREMISNV